MRFCELTSDEKTVEVIDFVTMDDLIKAAITCLPSFLILGP
jgi:Flp pilus assembly CpaF family ATPase